MEKKFIPLLLALMLCVGLLTPASAADGLAPAPAFTDVPTSHWAYSDITSMAAQKVVNGVGNGKFAPEASVKCAEFTAMVARLLFSDELSKQSSTTDRWPPRPEVLQLFADEVSKQPAITNWWVPGLEVLYQLGILDGTALLSFYNNGAWNQGVTEKVINRYDMAQIMYNALLNRGMLMPTQAALYEAQASIADFPDVPIEYKNAVTTMYAIGCLTGMDSLGTFRGGDAMQRDQACVALSRLQKKAFENPVLSDNTNNRSNIEIIPEREESTMDVGDTIIFSFPNAAEGDYTLNIYSSDPTVVEPVDNTYIVAKKPGTAEVKVTMTMGNSVGSTVCRITVVNPDGNSHVPRPSTETYGIEQVRQEMLDAINLERAKVGASPLVLDEKLCEVAQVRAQELVQSFSHTRPDGRDCYSALIEMNINYRSAGENIAAGQTTVDSVMECWMNSSGHRANILDQRYRKIGIGLYHTDSGYGWHWVQTFTN